MALPVLTGDSPAPGQISWTATTISYAGGTYGVPAGLTDKQFVWWQYNAGAPYLRFTNNISQPVGDPPDPYNLATMTVDDLLLFVNSNGVPIYMPNITTVPGSLLVPGTVKADYIDVLVLKASQYMESDGYTSGATEGWHIGADGNAYFNNISARGQIEVQGASNVAANLTPNPSSDPPVTVPSDAYLIGEGVALSTFADGTLGGWSIDSSPYGAASYQYTQWSPPGVRSEQDGSILLVAATPGTNGDIYFVSPSFRVNNGTTESLPRRMSVRLKAAASVHIVVVGCRWYTSTNGTGSVYSTTWGSPGLAPATDWGSVAAALTPPPASHSGKMVVRIIGCVADASNWWDQIYIETCGIEAPPASSVAIQTNGSTGRKQVKVTSTAGELTAVSAKPNPSYPHATQAVIAGESWTFGATVARPVGAGSTARLCSLGALWSDTSGGFIGLDLLLTPPIAAGQSVTLRQMFMVPNGATTLTLYCGLLALSGEYATFDDIVAFKASTMTAGIIETSESAPSIKLIGPDMKIWPDPTTVTPGGIGINANTQGVRFSSARGGSTPSTPASSLSLDTNPGGTPTATLSADALVIQSAASGASAIPPPGNDILGPWTSWTPTLDSGLGWNAVTARMHRLGKLVTLSLKGYMTGSNGGTLHISGMPDPILNDMIIGTFGMMGGSLQPITGTVRILTGPTRVVFYYPTNNAYSVQLGVTGSLAVGQGLPFSFTVSYELA